MNTGQGMASDTVNSLSNRGAATSPGGHGGLSGEVRVSHHNPPYPSTMTIQTATIQLPTNVIQEGEPGQPTPNDGSMAGEARVCLGNHSRFIYAR